MGFIVQANCSDLGGSNQYCSDYNWLIRKCSILTMYQQRKHSGADNVQCQRWHTDMQGLSQLSLWPKLSLPPVTSQWYQGQSGALALSSWLCPDYGGWPLGSFVAASGHPSVDWPEEVAVRLHKSSKALGHCCFSLPITRWVARIGSGILPLTVARMGPAGMAMV